MEQRENDVKEQEKKKHEDDINQLKSNKKELTKEVEEKRQEIERLQQ